MMKRKQRKKSKLKKIKMKGIKKPTDNKRDFEGELPIRIKKHSDKNLEDNWK
jgi:hypothetical protein